MTDKACNDQLISPKDISGSDVYVKNLPNEYHAEIQSENPGELFCILLNSKPLRTPKGKLILHREQRPLRELAGELDYSDKLEVHGISLFNLSCTQIDFIDDHGLEWAQEQVDAALLNDPVLKTCAGPEVSEQFKYLHIIDDYLKELHVDYPHLPQIPLEDHSWFSEQADANFKKLIDHIVNTIGHLNAQQLASFITIVQVFDSPVLGIMLAKQRITPHEFAVAYLTSQCINSKVWSGTDRNRERDLLEAITRDVECILRYLHQFSPKISEIEELIQSGESIRLEFKSTLRWNIRASRTDPKMEHAVLKSIVAFLNTDGGTLLIGVEDKGAIIGIKEDRFQNDDKYLLHFTNLVNDKIGKRHADLIRWDLKKIGSEKVLRVDCNKSSSPVFLQTKGQEEFYIRTGPSTVQLSGSEILDWYNQHYSE